LDVEVGELVVELRDRGEHDAVNAAFGAAPLPEPRDPATDPAAAALARDVDEEPDDTRAQ